MSKRSGIGIFSSLEIQLYNTEIRIHVKICWRRVANQRPIGSGLVLSGSGSNPPEKPDLDQQKNFFILSQYSLIKIVIKSPNILSILSV